ncbi:type II toxin-antitoxin system RelE/ParE family toxin [Pseudomonas meliae]|uniref:type II toxin-antitoxin system RelE/ParE family toxin n=1 Tax=Pseudomonas meliae TaxID=86176 RepID=UPI0005CA1D19|nr:type II toxin-antitoxin system RelE/ParE family toxin [Pseudomonas meliae]
MTTIKQTSTYMAWERRLKDQKAIFRVANGLMGDVSPVGQGVSELRIHVGPGYRVYFQQRGDELILLLCGGDKSSQSRDIETAKKLADQWWQE